MKSFRTLSNLEQLRHQLEQKRLDTEKQLELDAQEHQRELADKKLFETAMRDVHTLAPSNLIQQNTPKPPPRAIQKERDAQAVLHESLSDELDLNWLLDSDDTLSYRTQGVARDALDKLRRGQWVIQAQIDLHGLRTDPAREAVSAFMQQCVKKNLRCVRIIHGKGLGSVGKIPVLKEKVKRWLVQKQEVLAFCQASPRDGGAGALLVLLQSNSTRTKGNTKKR